MAIVSFISWNQSFCSYFVSWNDSKNIFIVPNLGFHWQARSFVYHSDEEEFPEKKIDDNACHKFIDFFKPGINFRLITSQWAL